MAELHDHGCAVLVAGGAGFLGMHLCRELLGQGHHVLCLDSFISGSRENVAALASHPRFELIEHDVIDPLPRDIRPDAIYNLACPASPPRYQRDPVHTLRTCVQGAWNLLERAEQCGAPMLQASTSEVYGDAQVHPQHERYHGNVNPVGPRSCYDEGKRCAETLCSDFARQRGTVVKIARIFNTYGPGMTAEDGRVVSNFICQALARRPLSVYGDGSQTRSLCYVGDMIDGLLRLMHSSGSFRGPVNLGNTEELSVLEIARRICALASDYGPHHIEFMPLPADDPTSRRPDTTLARRHLQWRPRVSFQDGLERTFRYFEHRLTATKSCLPS
ncbi:MAG TPA: UDP-glucuronic acid decarboxylase family protein [Burkholderiaceae bacterium]|nr:UDP-glucuronic acid decarboxylase family protein [Burkholderiaceae bacterium]